MAKTITMDGVEVSRLQLLKNPNGEIEIYAEYALKAGNQVVQARHEPLGSRLGGARKAAAKALFDAIAQDVTADELS